MHEMIASICRRVRSLSWRTEIAIVIAGAFGYLILISTLSRWLPHHGSHVISGGGLTQLAVYELVVLITLGAFLRVRGWTLRRLGLALSVQETLAGIGLAVVAYAAFVLTYYGFRITMRIVSLDVPTSAEVDAMVEPNLSAVTILVISVVNPVFEETFVCGYFLSALDRIRNPTIAIALSVSVRCLYHTYQGALGVLSVAVLGVVFNYAYIKRGRLWPIIVAHSLFDVIGLAARA